MALSDRDRKAMLVGAGVVLAAVLYRVALSPIVTAWSEARLHVVERRAVVERVASQIDRRDAIHARLRDRFGPAIDGTPPTLEEMQVAFPKIVRDALGKGGANPGSVDVQGVRKLRDVPGVSLLSLRVDALGKADAIPAALEALRTAERVIVIDSIQLTMAQSGNREQWRMTMQLSTPVLEGGKP